MAASRLLLLIFMVITLSECSDTAEPLCEDFDLEIFSLAEAEAFYFVPYSLPDEYSAEEFSWYKNNSQITTDKNMSVHYDGEALFFLNLCPENSGFYTARQDTRSGRCYKYHVKIEVFKQKANKQLLYGEIKKSNLNEKVPCPSPVRYTCDKFKGNLTWEKNFQPLQTHGDVDLWVYNATKSDDGIYTCTCTWMYSHAVYKSSGSRRLKVNDTMVIRKLVIISPASKELLVDKGFGIKLNCSVMCGINVVVCLADWEVNGILFNQTDRSYQIKKQAIKDPSNTIATTVLTIDKVSAKDFQAKFKCIGKGFYETVSETLILKKRESIIPLVIRGVCVFVCFCVLAAMLVKWFAIDIALLFRPYFPRKNHNQDAKVYDGYVIYQMQSMDKVTEDRLCQFVTKTLPSVLEKKCGYRLFIHGRDDIPGEDHLEVVENHMKQSRRLIVILTPSSGSGCGSSDQHPALPLNSVIAGFDWQVGLHHALVQMDMSVILIQLGDTGPEGYTHLPPGLQHVIRTSAPIRWPENSQGATSWNSRFWKRVRYLMPATPAKKYPQPAII